MSRDCFVCRKWARGFGWSQPPLSIRHYPVRLLTVIDMASPRKYCSKQCQDIDTRLRFIGVNVDNENIHTQAIDLTIGPLADYICQQVGVTKSLEEYTKDNIVGLIETVVASYHRQRQSIANQIQAQASSDFIEDRVSF
ncbi:DUF6511 domain-containing protein [Teredinibacter sp. KSP-S5-2]|uniref:DUF6511 domain-containing protein n=1 Tax=Teredinibacter sp. KSP-S5-2 TaxID=3034506 RepID=UPI0029348EA3|nr:DUF6511 domain-containing protein [Teredinibacter sp. KSP-S5-2]WNO10399.1 DUF6511 domain-containing protein [Teredinibacter sp. KSP-S5-2]WNO10518.1 DUF6511 domain-containing protein [Teredinibacter sp. KSP-S5-2]